VECLEDRVSPSVNPIVAENALPGTPQSVWDVSGAGDPTIQGFTDNISYNLGQTVNFKTNTPSTNYRLDIYRMGYYGGNGARLITSIQVTLAQPQVQPSANYNPTTGLYDCGDWGMSASWTIPTNLVSGVYFADAVREDKQDPGGTSMIVFIVRNDASTSDISFKLDTNTWEAYNNYGGQSLYSFNSSSGNQARQVSYNRPFIPAYPSWLTWAEYPMIRYMEENGYNLSYITDVDADRYGSLMLNHKTIMDAGHDEYWSAGERNNLATAAAYGVNLAFFAGNTSFWKTSWLSSIDGTNTPYRTIVCYKESQYGSAGDPYDPPTWTGAWRDPAGASPDDGDRPENALTGQLWMVDDPTANTYVGSPITVPYADSQLRFWANTAVASLTPGQTTALGTYVLGYEFDVDADNGLRPAGEIDMSSTTVNTNYLLLNVNGVVEGPGTATNSATLYRASSGALVFDAGTVQWSWGLDSDHEPGWASPTDASMQQATVNLFAMMGDQPGSLMAGLVAASAATEDNTPPVSTITSPTTSTSLLTGATCTVTGTASDAGGGVVAGVEISTDGGNTWHPASIAGAFASTTWTYSWTPLVAGAYIIMTRGTNDSAYTETPSDALTVTVSLTNTTPPTLSNVAVNPTSTTTVPISWTTNKVATSKIEYGTSPQSLTSVVSNSTLVTSHNLSLTGLTPGTLYYYYLLSTDQYGNVGQTPSAGNPPASFAAPTVVNATVAGFNAGTVSNTAVTSNSGGGQVQLLSTGLYDNFPGSTLDSLWTTTATGGGSSRVTVSNNDLSVYATEVDSLQGYVGASFEAYASFAAQPYQDLGMATSLESFTGNDWAVFATMTTTNTLYARVCVNGTDHAVGLGALPSGYHDYQIQPVSGGFEFFVDGVLYANLGAAMPQGTAMRAAIYDYSGSQPVQVEWVKEQAYARSGTYTSAVFNAGAPVAWSTATWTDSVPIGTNLTLFVRMGNTATPDATWTSWIPMPSPAPVVIGCESQYIQYQADFTTSTVLLTPVLDTIALYTASSDTVQPTVVSSSPSPGATNVSPNAPIVIAFSELMNTATISTSTVHLQLFNTTTDVPATVTYSGSTLVLQPNAPLAYEAGYEIILNDTISDTSGNPLNDHDSDQDTSFWTFTTSDYSFLGDVSAANFNAGTEAGTQVTSGGQVELAGPTPGLFDDFAGTALSAAWTTSPSGYGTSRIAVANSSVSVLATEMDSAQSFVGLPFESLADFGASQYQDIGLATSLQAYAGNFWAVFGTDATTNTLFARVNVNGTTQDINLGALPSGYHDYKIQPVASGFQFLVDGALKTTVSATFPQGTALKATLYDAFGNSQPLQVDWVMLGTPPASGTFTSRVFNAGASNAWQNVSWTASTPTGTSVNLAVRMGNTPTPDATWTSWTPISGNGGVIGGASEYLQYQATLSSNSALLTPLLSSVTLAYNNVFGTLTPMIVSVSPASGVTGISPSAPVQVTFNELMNAASITASTLYLCPSGSSTAVPASITYSGSTAVLQPTASLAYNATYQVIVSTGITDASGNPLANSTSWTFTTNLYNTVGDSSLATFSAGTVSGTQVSASGNGGQVQLAPPTPGLFDNFPGSALSSAWTTTATGGGTSNVTVANNVLAVKATEVDSAHAYAGLSFQAMVAFGPGQYQHFGLATSLAGYAGNYWAIFSTMATTSTLYARVNVNGATQDISLGALPSGYHNYLIQPVSGGFAFYVDGVLETTITAAMPQGTALKAAFYDYSGTSQPLRVSEVTMGAPPLSGTFTSRILDAGATAAWANGSWTASIPTGTTVGLAVRTGNTATPDASWTSWVPLSGSGATIGGASRYIQYQATLTSNVLGVSPVLQSVSFAYNNLTNTLVPRVVSISPPSGATGVSLSAPVVITFSELMNGATINTSTLQLVASGSTTPVGATVSYSGSTATLQPTVALAYNTTYQVLISGSIADASGNTLGAQTTSTFSTNSYTYAGDSTTANFSAGTVSGAQVIGNSSAGQVVLAAPSSGLSDNFTGSSLSSSWTTISTGGGTAHVTVASNVLSVYATEVDSAQAYPGASFEARVAFGPSQYQHFGLATSLAGYAGNYWAIFSTMGTTNTLYARVNVNGATQDVSLGALPSGYHNYLIEPVAGGFEFLVDGVLKTTISAAMPQGTALRGAFYDYYGNSQPLQVNSVVIGALPQSGTFTSRVFDGGATVAWANATWSAATPTSTGVSLAVRMGNTATPDATWTSWIPLTSSGATIGGASRYLQYQATLTTTDLFSTPVLQSVTLAYNNLVGTLVPRVVSVSPVTGATGVSLRAPATINFSELMNAATINTTTLYLRASGSTTNVPAAVSYSGSTAILQPTTALASNTTYQVTLSGSITDASGNSLGSTTSTFTTGVGVWQQQTVADFGAGTNAGTQVTSNSGGQVQLAPASAGLADKFVGSSLSSLWTTTPTGGGSAQATVSNNVLSVSADEVDSTQTFVNTPFEARVAFGGQYQSFGLATSLQAYAGNSWAIFSTMATTNTLFARVTVNGTEQVVNLGALPSGFHNYLIEPVSGGFQFYVDGVLRTTINATLPQGTALHAAFYTYNGGTPLQANWVSVENYAATGTFTSSVFDATRTATWGIATWTANLPSGTTITVLTRSGNTATPDSSWSAWASVTNGGTVASPAGRYLQYEIIFTTSDPTQTANLSNFDLTWF
jgi:hypothetical protein